MSKLWSYINDVDSKFCESCGVNLKTPLSSRAAPKESTKKEEIIDQSNKILILVGGF